MIIRTEDLIRYTDRKRLTGIEFNDYLKIDAKSHSGLKQNKGGFERPFVATNKVKIGKLVDGIITLKEGNLSDPLYHIAKDIAAKMKAELGDKLLNLLSYQIAYTSFLEYDGFTMYTKGLVDAELKKRAIIDFKVNNSCKTVNDCIKLIEYMGYNNSMYNYGRMADIENRFIFLYSTVVKKTFFLKILQSQQDIFNAENWWQEKILEHGNIF